MTILVVNLGTSDLSIRPLEHQFYLPISFNDRESNLVLPPINSLARKIWDNRQQILCDNLCQELDVTVTRNARGERDFSFREFTFHLWQAYQADFNSWHDRIRPCRLWGVLNTAKKDFEVRDIYLFITDQKPPHLKDTVYTYQILKDWLKREIPDLNLYPKMLPDDVKANDTDQLLQYYYHFFAELNQDYQSDQHILISIKGGTPQMQMGLRVQAMTAQFLFQANIEPELTIENVLGGVPSPCKLGVYWQYAKGQRYQAIKLLLSRYDFDGAEVILEDWQKFLDNIVKKKLTTQDVQRVNIQLKNIIAILHVAKSCLSLDTWEAQRRLKFWLQKQSELAGVIKLDKLLLGSNYDSLLNLYTQCRIYRQLGHAANFLIRMSSFYEQAQLRLVQLLGGDSCFERNERGNPKDWCLDSSLLKSKQIWNVFNDAMISSPYPDRFRNHNFLENPIFQLLGRDNKNNFLKVLLTLNENATNASECQRVLKLLSGLDFWCSTRNDIIHNADGPALHRLNEHLQRCQSWHPLALTACSPGYDGEKLLEIMTEICNSNLNLVKPEYRNYFVGLNSQLYIYDVAKDWIESQLK